MPKKVFIVDVSRCNGCHSCQIACKDEHCGTSWLPYAAEQPETGQFWCKVEEQVHGSVPKVNITYTPVIGAQSEALRTYAPEVLMERADGLIVLDPAKAKGRQDIAEKFNGVYWNEAEQVPQGCTGCAHLLDNGWSVPRCVDACPVGALRFGSEEDFADELESAERLDPESSVFYLNLPKRWVAGQVVDPAIDEVVIGAPCKLLKDGSEIAATKTDEFGDFWFRQIEPGGYEVAIEVPGATAIRLEANTSKADINLGTVLVS